MTTASGLGLTTLINGFALDAWFPAPALGPLAEDPALREQLTAAAQRDEARGTIQEVVALEIDLDAAPESTADAYLRLHLLSHRVMQPNTINLDGIFTHLPNVVWTTEGPCRIEGFELVRAKLRAEGRMPTVLSIDKFPRMVDYVLPTGVRIADADRVRLGAHLADGTTVMHEGFVNFNAGTLGTSERVVKARELSGLEGLLFRRNSVTGRVEAVAKSGVQVTLDAQLHAN